MHQKILVIEDNDEVRNNICDILEANNFKVSSASDGIEGYQSAVNQKPDLIISDIMMPNSDGYELLNKLREDSNFAAIPFVFLTAKTNYEDVRKGMNLGADDYIQKPFTIRDILDSVKTNLNKSKKLDVKLNELRESIALYIPHELRTPLASILGYTELLREELKETEASPTVKWIINSISEAGIRLNDVINKFIRYAEIAASSEDPVFLKKIKEEIIPSCEVSIRVTAHRVGFQFNRSEDIEYEINDSQLGMIPGHFEMIIEELVQNAVKYSKPASKIKIIAQASGKIFNISVTDFGIGMTSEQIEKISAFSQFDRKLNEIGGNGLGLATIKKIINMYEGTFIITSEPKKFTTVTIGIPLI